VIDLWPDDIEHTTLKAPVTILKEQGALLARKTGNIVGGLADRTQLIARGSPDDRFRYSFYLSAPAINYVYQLLKISHSDDLYPVEITAGEELYAELPDELRSKLIDDGSGVKLIADSEDKFMEILKAIFATEKVRKVIGAIIAQSGVGTEPE
jgi:hypothetical protein